MARVLGILGSFRRNGNSAWLLREALEGVREVEGAQAELVPLAEYNIAPCTGCRACLKSPHVCILDDDLGGRGTGILFRKVQQANGVFLANPVYMWGTCARLHIFTERMYPFAWSGELRGLPFASLSVATIQGMHRQAEREICKWGCAKFWRPVGSLPVHICQIREALPKARALGRKLAMEALRDEREGRAAFREEEHFLNYLDTPWEVLEEYLDNLTEGRFTWKGSLVQQALEGGYYTQEWALEVLTRAGEELKVALEFYQRGEREEAARHLARLSSYWVHGTRPRPLAQDYRSLPETW